MRICLFDCSAAPAALVRYHARRRVWLRSMPPSRSASSSDSVDSRFEDAERSGGGSALRDRSRLLRVRLRSQVRVPIYSRARRIRMVIRSRSKRCGGRRSGGGRPILSHLRSQIDIRHPPQRGRRCGRVGDSTLAPGRCEGLQEILADETSNEARSSGKAEPARE
jgi:hypothetical protein